jgi:cephalosporin hydroxylase
MVILDSDHHKDHVLRELEIYSKFVTNGSYIIVEDTNINGHPVRPKFGPGPTEAVKEFLKGSRDFVIDKSREKFFLTFNPNGYLKKR